MADIDEESLEKVIKKRVSPLLDEFMNKHLGITIKKLGEDLSDRIARPLTIINIDTGLSFKAAKKLFKKQYIEQLLKTHYGNITKAALISGLNRRSIHRAIKELGVEIEDLRKHIPNPKYVKKMAMDSILRNTLETYKQIIHPKKLENMYKNISSLSEGLIRELPITEMSWKDAEHEFEHDFIKKALEKNKSIKATAKRINLRYETLIRKMKKLNLSC